MDLGLRNKRALVTGASRGLGDATASLLASEGYAVALNSRSSQTARDAAASISAETGTLGIGLAGDVSVASVPERLAGKAASYVAGVMLTVDGGMYKGAF